MTTSSEASGEATLFVTYVGNALTRFDRDHYVSAHLPLVRKAWGPYGLVGIDAFFPAGDGAGTIAVAVCRFHNEVAMANAFGSLETKRVLADVKNFTDVEPARSRGVPL